MSDVPQGPGWWQASDLRWYPPTASPGVPVPAPPPVLPPTSPPAQPQTPWGSPPTTAWGGGPVPMQAYPGAMAGHPASPPPIPVTSSDGFMVAGFAIAMVTLGVFFAVRPLDQFGSLDALGPFNPLMLIATALAAGLVWLSSRPVGIWTTRPGPVVIVLLLLFSLLGAVFFLLPAGARRGIATVLGGFVLGWSIACVAGWFVL